MYVSDVSNAILELPLHKVIGLKVHNHLQDVVDEMYKEYIFCLLFDDNTKQEFTITLINSIIMHSVEQVRMFGALTHVPKRINETLKIEDIVILTDDEFAVDFDKLRSTNRGFDKVPLWIFKGASGLGKSFLAHNIKGLKIFETDSSPKLPDIIIEDIVVLGNKHPHTIEDILLRVKNRNIILNTFEHVQL